MERVEREWITGWEFSKENERAYHAVELPHDWAVDAPFCPEIEGGASQGYRDRWGGPGIRCNLRTGQARRS